jgi:hypothetical protein
VLRDSNGDIKEVRESREIGGDITEGERDIGIFIFRYAPTMEFLEKNVPGKIGSATGEHGFLYIIGELVSHGYKVEGIPIAKESELISLNKIEDILNVI